MTVVLSGLYVPVMQPITHSSIQVIKSKLTVDSAATNLPEVTVSAGKDDKRLISSSPVHTITNGKFAELGVSGIADAMLRLPGLSLKDYGGNGGMKTVSVRGLGAQYTGVSYDGVMLSDVRSGQIDLSRFSLDNISSISLTIGDGDDIFIPARNASMPALLNIVGLTPSKGGGRTQLETRLKYGSFKTAGASVYASGETGGRFSYAASGEFIHAKNNYPFELRNGAVVTRERRTNSQLNTARGELQGIWKINNLNTLDAKVSYYNSYRQLPGQVRYYTDISHQRLHERNFMSQISSRTRISNIFSLRGDAKFVWSSSRYRDPSYPSNLRDSKYIQRETYASATLLATPHQDWSFSYAADWWWQNLSSIAIGVPDTHPQRNAVLQALTARFRNCRLTATAKLLGSLYFNKTTSLTAARDAQRLSPSLSVSYKILPNEELRVRAGYKSIFRMPTFTESYFFHFGNASLSPEKTDHINAGVTWKHEYCTGGNFSIVADGYYNSVRDMIVSVPYNMYIWTNINVGKSRALGVDISVDISQGIGLAHRLSLAANWSLQNVTDRTRGSRVYGNQIAYIPINSGAASLLWENPWVNVSIHTTASSARWGNNEHSSATRIAGYCEMGITLFKMFDFGRHSVELRADFRNILNSRYELIRLYPMPEFNYLLTVAYRFDTTGHGKHQ